MLTPPPKLKKYLLTVHIQTKVSEQSCVHTVGCPLSNARGTPQKPHRLLAARNPPGALLSRSGNTLVIPRV
jgi:hypothetical protein